MEISVIMPHLEVYGGIRRIVEISNNWIDLGHKVTIYHPEGTPCSWLETRFDTKALSNLLDKKHEVLLSVGHHFDIYKKAISDKKVTYYLGIYALNRVSYFKAIKIYLKGYREYEYFRQDPTNMIDAYTYDDVKITVSTWMKNWLYLHYGKNVHVVHGGVNLEMFKPYKIEKPNDGTIKVLSFGRNKIWKDQDTIKEAVRLANKIDNRICLHTYDGKGLTQESLAREYSSADIFINAEIFGGWSNPTAEAMACGVPVITTDVGAVRDFAIDGYNALFVPRKNPRYLATQILNLARNEPWRKYLSQNGLSTIAQFTWEKSAQKLIDIFNEY